MIYFIGAGPGDAQLITVKAQRILQQADAVLYTGSLVPKEVLTWCKPDARIQDSQSMTYEEIFDFLYENRHRTVARVHTGDPSLYSTVARQIAFLKEKGISYEIIPGVTAAFAAAASLGIEYTLPGVSQTLIITRMQGRTPNPESMQNLLRCRHASYVFYLSASLLDKLVMQARDAGFSPDTPCWVAHKVSWPTEEIVKGTLEDIVPKASHIRGIALILLGDFLHQIPAYDSHLYVKPLLKELKK